MSQRLAELSALAENDEDVALQLESEKALTLEPRRVDFSPELIAWADEVANSYIIVNAPKVDDETLNKLAEEVDF